MKIEVTGPLFTRAKPIIRHWAQRSVHDLVEMGMERLDQTLRPRPGGVYLSVTEARRGKASTGNFRRTVHDRISNLNALIQTNSVYGPWLDVEAAWAAEIERRAQRVVSGDAKGRPWSEVYADLRRAHG